MKPRVVGTLLLVSSLVLCVSASSAAPPNGLDLLSPTQTAAIAKLVDENPQVRFDVAGSRITKLYGPAFAWGNNAEDTAERFRLAHAPLFGVAPESLNPRGPLADGRHTQPVMFDPQTGQYKFTLVYYTQEAAGLPVFRSNVRLLVRNEQGYPLVLVNSTLRGLGGFVPAAAVAPRADLAQAQALAAHPALIQFSAPKQIIWAGTEDSEEAPRLAIEFIGHTADVTSAKGYQEWLFVADAVTGAIIYEENQVLHVDVSGNISGMATQPLGADICQPEAATPLPYARASIGGTIVYADVNGNFTIPNGGATPVTVDAPLRGRRFIVNDQQGATPTLSQSVTPPGPANFLHNAANTSEFVRASVNAYLQANTVRDMVVAANPAYPTIGTQIDMAVNTNIGQNCNAFYSPANGSINFYIAGGGCANSAFGDVVHHEYGHHVVQMAGSGQGAYGEGMGDCMGVLLSDQPVLGFGFQLNCAAGIRNANNNCNYVTTGCSTCGSAIHTCGQLISGCVWNTRNQLIVTEPVNYLNILKNLTVNSVLLHTGTSITPQITIDFLTLDDNDANIGNGTPHYSEIAAGFGSHNMPAPPLSLLAFQYPNGRPQFLTPNQTTTVDVNVLPLASTPVHGTGTVSYRIGTSGSFTTVPMNVVGTNQYQAVLPAASCTSTVQYYFSSQASNSGSQNDPTLAPTVQFSAVAAVGFVAYNFETTPAWTVASTATDGQWDPAPGVPVNCSRGDPPSDFDGSGKCWLTDNSAANSCNSDVDGGSTTLTSEVFNLSGLNDPYVSYARWYSNTFGAEPQADIFVIEVSSNGGGSWAPLEIVGPTTGSPNPEVNGGWFVKTFRIADFVTPTSQFRIRFIASDNAGGSVIEAAIDAFKIYDCLAPCGAATGDVNEDTFLNALDVEAMVAGLLGTPTPSQICAGDFNTSSTLDVGDIDGLVDALLAP